MVPNNDPAVNVPTDAHGNPLDRAMGVPLVQDGYTLQSATKYVDIFDLSAYPGRSFTGISVKNPHATVNIYLAIGDDFANTKNICIPANSYVTFDDQLFGQANGHEKFRAKLATATGTAASGTLDYDNTAMPVNPSDGQTVTVNGYVYEFSNDGSIANPSGSNIKVDIKATADLTWTEFVAVVNATDQAVTASVNTTSNLVTITSNYGGATGDAMTLVSGVTNVVASGGTLSGSSGGIVPIFHIW